MASRPRDSGSESASEGEGPSHKAPKRARGLPGNTPGFLRLSADAEREGRKRSASRSRSTSPQPSTAGDSSRLTGHSLASLSTAARKRSRSPSPVGGVTRGAALSAEASIEEMVSQVIRQDDTSRGDAKDLEDVQQVCGGYCWWCLEFEPSHRPRKCSKREIPDISLVFEVPGEGLRRVEGGFQGEPAWKLTLVGRQ